MLVILLKIQISYSLATQKYFQLVFWECSILDSHSVLLVAGTFLIDVPNLVPWRFADAAYFSSLSCVCVWCVVVAGA